MNPDVTGPPKALCAIMSAISEDHWSAGWLHDLEWFLWADLTAWRNGRPTAYLRDGDGGEWLPALDVVQRAVGGWVWWISGPEFVDDARWAELVAARASFGVSPPEYNREVLARAGRVAP